MPRWKALPEDLEPQIKEFTGRLRRLVDDSGLSIAALADRTGYGKTSWERYLGGRLLAPKGAVIALAEATGTDPGHLTTLWELAERAWTRAELRHDHTLTAVRITEARAALGDLVTTPEPVGGAAGGASVGGGAAVVPGIAGPAGVSPTIPARPADSGTDIQDSVPPGWGSGGSAAASGSGMGSRAGSDGADAPPKNSWGLAGYRGPSKATARPGPRPPASPRPPAGPAGPAGTPAGAVRTPASATPDPDTPARTPAPGTPDSPRWSARWQQVVMFFAGLVGVGALIAGVLFFTHGDGVGRKGEGGKSPSPSAPARPSPPPGVQCAGAACTGKDAEAMGCSGELVTTAKTATVGPTTLEVRYSKACGTAWGRITSGAPGDTVRVFVGKVRQTGDITAAGDTIGYTPMIAVRNPAQARACATLATGQTGCTE
ncbi:DUF2690 domain-containing protein [Streptomyces sp. NPDC088760]|uniref:helix-turn-helix domain-containing protein n=1 Tax=Streptomyces sp. NPDC088760 TaxID=3365890 RepID=UPI0037F776E7